MQLVYSLRCLGPLHHRKLFINGRSASGRSLLRIYEKSGTTYQQAQVNKSIHDLFAETGWKRGNF